MFSDYQTESSGFSSSWKFSRTSGDSSVQTKEILAVDKEDQAIHTFHVAVQTEQSDMTSATYDEARLAAFLTRVCPAVVQELDRICYSNALSTYSQAQDSESEVKELLTLCPPFDNVKVSQLSWSCTGSVLAVARSHTLHSSWCHHQGHIALYNVDRESKIPSCVLEATSCVKTISMHPYLPPVIVAGTFSGEVVVWDTAKEGSEACLVNTEHTMHTDSVTQVCWVPGMGTAVILVSSGSDGYLYFWKVSPQLMSYQVTERFLCDVTNTQAGVTCFAFPHGKQDTFVVAKEGGALYNCSTTGAQHVDSVHLMKDPVISRFEPQPATVTSIAFSHHQNCLFATVSTDQIIRIYNLSQMSVERKICGVGALIGLSWVPSQVHILTGWGHQSTVSLYNSHTGNILSTLSPDIENNSQISAATFNVKSIRLFAVGDLDGTAHVWKLPPYIAIKP